MLKALVQFGCQISLLALILGLRKWYLDSTQEDFNKSKRGSRSQWRLISKLNLGVQDQEGDLTTKLSEGC